MQVENRSGEGQVVHACVACHGSTPLTSTRDRHLEDPNVMLTGTFSGKLHFYLIFSACMFDYQTSLNIEEFQLFCWNPSCV